MKKSITTYRITFVFASALFFQAFNVSAESIIPQCITLFGGLNKITEMSKYISKLEAEKDLNPDSSDVLTSALNPNVKMIEIPKTQLSALLEQIRKNHVVDNFNFEAMSPDGIKARLVALTQEIFLINKKGEYNRFIIDDAVTITSTGHESEFIVGTATGEIRLIQFDRKNANTNEFPEPFVSFNEALQNGLLSRDKDTINQSSLELSHVFSDKDHYVAVVKEVELRPESIVGLEIQPIYEQYKAEENNDYTYLITNPDQGKMLTIRYHNGEVKNILLNEVINKMHNGRIRI